MAKINYRKNKKSILTSLLLILCLTFTGIAIVYADSSTDPSGGNGGTSIGDACKVAGKLCYSRIRWGVRITLVDDNGNKIGTKGVDIWKDNPTTGEAALLTYFQGGLGSISGKFLKKDVVAYGGNEEQNLGAGFNSVATASNNIYVLSREMSSNEILKGIQFFWIYQSLGVLEDGKSLSTAIKNFDSYLMPFVATGDAKLSLNMNNFFELLGYSKKWEELTSEDLQKMYFQFEPLMVFRINLGNGSSSSTINHGYGTVTELAYTNMSGLARLALGDGGAGVKIDNTLTGNLKNIYSPPSSTKITNSDDLKSNVGFGISFMWLGKYDKSTCDLALKNIKDYSSNIDADIAKLVNGDVFVFYNNPSTTAQLEQYEREYTGLQKAEYSKPGREPFCGNFPPDEEKECDSVDATIKKDSCITGISYFKDNSSEDNWLVCGIAYSKDGVDYSSDNTGHEAVETDYDNLVGNSKYCEIFCYEEIETKFPTTVYDVKAGQTFTWGEADGTFGNIKIKKHCSTREGGYKFTEWHNKYLTNEKTKIDQFRLYKSYEEAMKDSHITTGATRVCCSTDSRGRCRRYGYDGWAKSDRIPYTHTLGSDSGWMSSISGAAASQNGSSSCASSRAGAMSAAKADLISTLESLRDTAETNYETADGNEIPYLKDIFQCFSNLKYIYKTTVNFIFEEPVNAIYGINTRAFNGKWEMDVEPNPSPEGYNEVNFVNNSSCKIKKVYSYECTGEGSSAKCVVGGYSSTAMNGIQKSTTYRGPGIHEVVDCGQATWDISGEYIYSYPPEDFQWFSDKRDSTLVNTEPSSDEKAYFYSIGFGLPTAFSLTSGKYDMAVVVGNLGDHATTTGAQTYNVINGHFYPIADLINNISLNNNTISVDQVYGFEYKCTYEVENEIFGYDCVYEGNALTVDSPAYCDNTEDNDSHGTLKGIDVAYRIISLLGDTDPLDKAFPGIDGSGRNMGANWDKLGSAKIYEILDDDVYNSLAMYEIMLDVNAIQYIRRNNNEYLNQDKDPYTSYTDANGAQKVYCKSKGSDGQFKYCASEFLTELNTTTSLNYNLMGTCLPSGMGTEARAQHELDDECSSSYVYPTISWER